MNQKGVPEVVKYADGSVGAGVTVRMLCRGGCLPVRASECMTAEMEV